MLELAAIPTVQAVKQATEELDQARRIVDETGLGSTRAATTSSTRFSRSAAWAALSSTEISSRGASEGDGLASTRKATSRPARTIDEEPKPLVDVLGVTINPIPVKAALNMLGHEVGGLRLPLVEATEDEISEIRSVLERVGLTAPARV